MKEIKLTQEAYVDGYEGSFLRFRDEDGCELAGGIWGSYYTASAVDDEGSQYEVFWRKWSEDVFEIWGESFDWNSPEMVLDADGRAVTDSVIVVQG